MKSPDRMVVKRQKCIACLQEKSKQVINNNRLNKKDARHKISTRDDCRLSPKGERWGHRGRFGSARKWSLAVGNDQAENDARGNRGLILPV
jgi:hypothetical protein